MIKAPSNLPEIGDKVKLRGRKAFGKLMAIIAFNPLWCIVQWDDNNASRSPKICHLFELEKVIEDD